MWNYIGNIGAGWLVHNFRQPPVEGKAVNGTSLNFPLLANHKSVMINVLNCPNFIMS